VALNTTGLSLNYSDAHVVGAKTIGATGTSTIGAITNSGSGSFNGTAGNLVVSVASDYTLAQPTIADVTGSITAKTLTSTATIAPVAKTFDGLLVATGSTVAGSTGNTVGTDTVALNTTGLSLNYSDAHVVGAKTIGATGTSTIGAITNSGSGSFNGTAGNLVVSVASDYTLAQPTIADVTGSITAKTLTSTATIAPVAKTFDGLLVATGSTVAGSTGNTVGTDTVALNTTGLSLNYSDAHVVGAKTIGATGTSTIGAITNSGSGSFNGTAGNLVVSVASDYTLAQPTIADVTGSITAKTLTSTATIAPVAKTFDGLLWRPVRRWPGARATRSGPTRWR